MTTATHCNPKSALGSIVRQSPASPAERVKCLARLLLGLDLGGLAVQVGRTRNHLSQVLNGSRQDSLPLRRDIASELGLTVDDIWSSGAGCASDPGSSLPHSTDDGHESCEGVR